MVSTTDLNTNTRNSTSSDSANTSTTSTTNTTTLINNHAKVAAIALGLLLGWLLVTL